jgi:general secretion pathway protein K
MATIRHRRGGALLTVLWLSAALSAIAFSLANTVRGEVERTSTAVDGLRSYYLAQAGVERGILYLFWGLENRMPPNAPFRYNSATPVLPFTFPSGEARVEVVPETAKLNINTSSPEDLMRLLSAMGVDPARAQGIAGSILDWRSPGGGSQLGSFYQSITPSFPARHASFEETEELLLVRGITPDLYYGGYNRDAEGRLVPRTGLKDCVSVFGATNQFDVNTAPAPVLGALGMPPDAVAAIMARRRMAPFQNVQQVADFAPGGGAAFGRLRVGGNSIFTVRSTARLRLRNGQLSDLRRSVGAMVKFMPPEYDTRIQILRWYDNAWTP